MNITLNGTKITQDTRNLAFEKNNGVDEIVITVDTDESWSYKLDVKYPDKYNIGNDTLYNIIDLDRNGNICSAILDSKMLPFNGKYTMQLRGISGDKVYHSDIFEAWVKYSIEPGSTYDPVPSEFYQIEVKLDDKVNEAKQYAENAETASTRMPKISPDKTWLIWDVGTGDYVDTGIKASGGGSGTSDHSLTFTGAVTGSYDGSAPLSVEIPAIDSTFTVKGKVADAKAVGDALITLSEDIASLQTSGLTTAQVNALDGMFKVCAFTKDNVSAEYTAFKTAFGIADSGGGGETEVTLTSISATYDGGDVLVGTAVTDLTGIVVTAHYSDGTSKAVTGYTLDGTIVEGENTVTVIYDGKMTEFTVVGVAESGGEVIMLKNISFDGKSYLDTEVIPESVHYKYLFGIQAPDKNVMSADKCIAGISMRNKTKPADSAYWDIIWSAICKTNNYNPDIPSFTVTQECMGLKGSHYLGQDSGNGQITLPYEYPMYYSFANGSQSAWLDEECTEEPTKGSFGKTPGTTDYTSQSNYTDDEHPIDSIWLGKVHVTGIMNNLATEANTYVGVKFYCFKVYDTDENLIADMKPAKQGDTVGMWDNIRNKFYPATVNGGTVSYEEASA